MPRQTVLVYRELPQPQLARIQAEHEVIQADPRREDQREAFFQALAETPPQTAADLEAIEARFGVLSGDVTKIGPDPKPR